MQEYVTNERGINQAIPMSNRGLMIVEDSTVCRHYCVHKGLFSPRAFILDMDSSLKTKTLPISVPLLG